MRVNSAVRHAVGIGFVLLCWAEAAAVASPISFVYTGTAAGTLGGVPFALAGFTITANADTDQVIDDAAVSYVDHAEATVSIDGLGDFEFATTTRTFVARALVAAEPGIVGLSRNGPGGLDLYNGPVSSTFADWDLRSSVGPVSGTMNLIQWVFGEPILTGSGRLIFTEGATEGTFQASVPEPTVIVLLLATGILRLSVGWQSRARRP